MIKEDADSGVNSKVTQLSTGKYRDTFFRKLFRDEKRILELGNAVMGTDYPDDAKVKLCHIDPDSILARFNDIAAFIETQIIMLCEHESGLNLNMPLRILLYLSQTIYSLIDKNQLHGKKLIQIPTPKIYVLYNGKTKLKKTKLKLSDAFMIKDNAPCLELEVEIIDINYNSGSAALAKSQLLNGYAFLIAEINKNMDRRYPRDKAIKLAVDTCIKLGILADFLKENYEEAYEMLDLQYSFDTEIRVREEQAEERGEERGIEKVVLKLLKKGESDNYIIEVSGISSKRLQELKEELLSAQL